VFNVAAQHLVQQTGKTAYVFDAENTPVIGELLRYFAQLPDGNCNPAKGILLAGNVGSGKTLLFEIFFHLVRPLRPFYKTTARQVAKDYAAEGLTALARYVRQFKQTTDGLLPVDFFFDDLGAEDNKKHYGNEANVMAEIIYDRYELFIRHKTRTHFTTNLTPQELEDKYGTRVYSRLCHMCNFLVLGNNETSTDRRMI
jgi:DNA replication protein DnaC